MPVTLEKIDQPSAQDLIDLQKIYNDFPGDFDWDALQALQATETDLQLYGARFNDRLLGAITTKAEQQTIALDHLCVRKVTRQRHVGRDLLRLLRQQYPQSELTLRYCQASTALTQLMLSQGFEQQGSQFTLKT